MVQARPLEGFGNVRLAPILFFLQVWFSTFSGSQRKLDDASPPWRDRIEEGGCHVSMEGECEQAFREKLPGDMQDAHITPDISSLHQQACSHLFTALALATSQLSSQGIWAGGGMNI